MKIILSKKGFDGSWGGYPNIISGNAMYSMPIPDKESTHTYGELKTANGAGLFDTAKLYYPRIYADKKRIPFTPDIHCHADPNISNYFGANNFVGSIGQVGGAQSHLEKEKINKDDIFLFFGWFREVKNGKFIKGTDKYTLFGYLQIGEIIYPQTLNETEKQEIEARHPWIKDQPHWDFNKYANRKNNCIYIARENCDFNTALKGWGTFAYNPTLALTKQDATKKSELQIPALAGLELSKTKGNKFDPNGNLTLPQTFGQEFVIEENEKATNWVQQLITQFATR